MPAYVFPAMSCIPSYYYDDGVVGSLTIDHSAAPEGLYRVSYSLYNTTNSSGVGTSMYPTVVCQAPNDVIMTRSDTNSIFTFEPAVTAGEFIVHHKDGGQFDLVLAQTPAEDDAEYSYRWVVEQLTTF